MPLDNVAVDLGGESNPMRRDGEADNPDIITDPQFIGLADVLLGPLLDYLTPMGFVAGLSLLFRMVVGGCLLALGVEVSSRR
jgi:hypothetical protein